MTHCALRTPHSVVPGVATLQSSTARAASIGSALSTARAESQVSTASSATMLQFSSEALYIGSITLPMTSTEFGLTLASQSLQSPAASLNPSMSSSTSVLVLQTVPPPPWPVVQSTPKQPPTPSDAELVPPCPMPPIPPTLPLESSPSEPPSLNTLRPPVAVHAAPSIVLPARPKRPIHFTRFRKFRMATPQKARSLRARRNIGVRVQAQSTGKSWRPCSKKWTEVTYGKPWRSVPGDTRRKCTMRAEGCDRRYRDRPVSAIARKNRSRRCSIAPKTVPAG